MQVNTLSGDRKSDAWAPAHEAVQPRSVWRNSRQVRCDTTFSNNTSTGCVISDVRPQLVMSESQYGAAAATYNWGEQILIDH